MNDTWISPKEGDARPRAGLVARSESQPSNPQEKELLSRLYLTHHRFQVWRTAYLSVAQENPAMERILDGKSTVEGELDRLEKLVSANAPAGEAQFEYVKAVFELSSALFYTSFEECKEDILKGVESDRKRRLHQKERSRCGDNFVLSLSGGGILSLIGLVALKSSVAFLGLGGLTIAGCIYFGRRALQHEKKLEEAKRELERVPYFLYKEEQAEDVQMGILKNCLVFDAPLGREEDTFEALFEDERLLSPEEKVYILLQLKQNAAAHPLTEELETWDSLKTYDSIAAKMLPSFTSQSWPSLPPISHYVSNPEEFLPWYNELSEEDRRLAIKELVELFQKLNDISRLIEKHDPKTLKGIETEGLKSRGVKP